MTEQRDTTQPAGGSPLGGGLRPRVWMVCRHDAPGYWIPFMHEPVDALKDPEREVVRLHWPDDVAAERERCAKLCDAIARIGPEAAYTAGKCAAAIRGLT
jgi:hypothetical protein